MTLVSPRKVNNAKVKRQILQGVHEITIPLP